MTPAELKAIRNKQPGRLAEEKDAVMAKALGWSVRTIRNKMAGKTRITKGDEALVTWLLNPQPKEPS